MTSIETAAREYVANTDRPKRLYDSCCSWVGADHEGWSKAQMRSAMEECFVAGAAHREQEVKALVQAAFPLLGEQGPFRLAGTIHDIRAALRPFLPTEGDKAR
jgi:hypothetical protein